MKQIRLYSSGMSQSMNMVDTGPTYNGVAKCVRHLLKNGIGPITQSLISKENIRPSYIALCNTDLVYDFHEIDEFTPCLMYNTPDFAHPMEIGTIGYKKWPYPVRVIKTHKLLPRLCVGAETISYLCNGSNPIATMRCDVYPVIVIGKSRDVVIKYEVAAAAI